MLSSVNFFSLACYEVFSAPLSLLPRSILYEALSVNMPEPLGAAVGAIAVTNILVDTILKLRVLIFRLKGLPVKLSTLISVLQLLTDTLSIIEDIHRQEPFLETSPLSHSVVEICNGLINELSETSFKVQKHLEDRSSLKGGWIKAAWKDHKIKDLEQQLFQTLQLLNCVIQTTTLEVFDQLTLSTS